MAWTYGDDPENSNRDAVRLLIGDTDTTDQQLTDAEIAFFIAEESGIYGAAAAGAKALASLYARKVDKSVGDLKLAYSDRQKHYLDLAAKLTERQAAGKGKVFVGGISVADKDDREADTDRVKPGFVVDQDNNPQAPTTSNRLWNTLD